MKWIPKESLAATIKNYGSDFDGALVEVGAFVPRDRITTPPGFRPTIHTGYFECHLLDFIVPFAPDDIVYFEFNELEPVNEATKNYMAEVIEVGTPIYADEVYDLRERLDAIGIAVTAESIAAFTPMQFSRVYAYTVAIGLGHTHVERPEELE